MVITSTSSSGKKWIVLVRKENDITPYQSKETICKYIFGSRYSEFQFRVSRRLRLATLLTIMYMLNGICIILASTDVVDLSNSILPYVLSVTNVLTFVNNAHYFNVKVLRLLVWEPEFYYYIASFTGWAVAMFVSLHETYLRIWWTSTVAVGMYAQAFFDAEHQSQKKWRVLIHGSAFVLVFILLTCLILGKLQSHVRNVALLPELQKVFNPDIEIQATSFTFICERLMFCLALSLARLTTCIKYPSAFGIIRERVRRIHISENLCNELHLAKKTFPHFSKDHENRLTFRANDRNSAIVPANYHKQLFITVERRYRSIAYIFDPSETVVKLLFGRKVAHGVFVIHRKLYIGQFLMIFVLLSCVHGLVRLPLSDMVVRIVSTLALIAGIDNCMLMHVGAIWELSRNPEVYYLLVSYVLLIIVLRQCLVSSVLSYNWICNVIVLTLLTVFQDALHIGNTKNARTFHFWGFFYTVAMFYMLYSESVEVSRTTWFRMHLKSEVISFEALPFALERLVTILVLSGKSLLRCMLHGDSFLFITSKVVVEGYSNDVSKRSNSSVSPACFPSEVSAHHNSKP